ncbi:MFS general substrate transporter [Lichtheimia hyalospora FSU 10163]|nr:MFS general substrate transporter [Lichtheimia hyalospora FSU 10163]
MMLSMFTVTINSTLVAPAMTMIATDLHALNNSTWIATAFMVGMVGLQPLSGKFADIFGRKPVLLFGLSLFLLGSLVNALSPTINGLIAGRALQGTGSGNIIPILYVVIADIAPLKWRPRMQSMMSLIYGLSSVVGPLIGGAFVDNLSWRWDFWLDVILAGIAIIINTALLKETGQPRTESIMAKIKRIDILGVITVIAFIVCLLLGVTWGPQYGWSDSHSIGAFVGAGVSLIALIFVETRVAKEPLMPREVMLNPGIFIVYMYMSCLGLSFMGTLYFAPMMYQAVFGADATGSGIRLIPFVVCLIIGSVSSGILLPRFPYCKVFIMVGAASNVLGYGLFSTVDENANWGRQACFLTFCGLAFGLSQLNAIMGVQSVAGKKYMAVATSLNNFFMLLCGSLAISVYQTVLQTFLQAQLVGVSQDVLAVANQYGALSNYLYIRDMPQEYQGPIIHAYMNALHNVFTIPLVAGGIGFICACFIRNIKYGVGLRPAPKKDAEAAPQPETSTSKQ